MRSILLVGIVIAAPTPVVAEWHVAHRSGSTAVVYTESSTVTAEKPVLAIQCDGRETSVTVYWRQPMAGYYAQSVVYSIDGSKRSAEQWRVSTDHRTLGVWGREAIPVARRLFGKNHLTVWAINRRGRLVSAHFEIARLDRAMHSAQACNGLQPPAGRLLRPGTCLRAQWRGRR